MKLELHADWGINYVFKKTKQVPLLYYWTSRYLATLLIGLVILGILSALWIRHTTIENNVDLMTFIAEDTVDRVTSTTIPEMPNEEL